MSAGLIFWAVVDHKHSNNQLYLQVQFHFSILFHVCSICTYDMTWRTFFWSLLQTIGYLKVHLWPLLLSTLALPNWFLLLSYARLFFFLTSHSQAWQSRKNWSEHWYYLLVEAEHWFWFVEGPKEGSTLCSKTHAIINAACLK